MIKAIETEYKGYKFRSRLEAKWAVLFDYINLKWEYEPDGFQMRGGAKYLPDFYFPEYGYYAEVKPPRPGMLQELEKAKNLVRESKDKAVVVLGNVPEVENDAWFHVPVICWDGLRRKVVVRWFVLGLENKTAIISDTYTDYLYIRDFENIKEEEWFEPISTRDFEKVKFFMVGTCAVFGHFHCVHCIYCV